MNLNEAAGIVTNPTQYSQAQLEEAAAAMQRRQKNFLNDDDKKYDINIAVLEAIDTAFAEISGYNGKVKDEDLPGLLPVLEAIYDKMYLRAIGLG